MRFIESRLVSSFILRNLREGTSSGSFHATVLLADMTGFTRLTHDAMLLGDGGAEWISHILSRSFSPFIEFVENEGGFIAEFEGDAALAVFPGDRPELLHRTQQLLEDVSKIVGEEIAFSAHSGSGEIHWGVSGSDGVLYQLFYGASIAQVFNLDHSFSFPATWMEATGETFNFFPSLITSKDFGGEFRTVFPAFLSLQVSSVEEAQTFFKSVCDFTSAMDGYLNGTHLRGKKATALVVFGAPRAHESDARRCGELAAGLLNLFPTLRAGISAGSAYSGFIGSGRRCDYTVLGSRVNLASRLCDKAEEGEILVNAQYKELVQNFFAVEQRSTLQLKGFKDSQTSYRISTSLKETSGDFQSGRFVGRKKEKRQLRDLFSSCTKDNRLSIVNILGEPGIGKSRLLGEFVGREEPEVFKLILSGDEFMDASDLHAWKKALQFIPQDLIRDLLKNMEHGELRSELQWANECLIRLFNDLQATASDENIAYSISVLLDSVAGTRRFIIGVENPDRMDSKSLQVLESFLHRQKSSAGVVVSTTRHQDQLPEFLRGESLIHLGPFSILETIEKLAADTGFTVQDSVAETLHVRSAGNPLYLEELSSIVQQDRLKGTWSTWQDMEQLLPVSMGSLLESRIDHLSGEMREAVAAASVLGLNFAPEILRHMLPLRSASITKGLSLGIWRIAAHGKLVFRHDLLRQTSYRMLLVSRRKSIHRLAADVILKLYPEPESEHLVSLAMHAAKADYPEIALKYLETAGDYCRSANQNQLAVDLYTELERFAEDSNTGMRAGGKKGAVLEIVGRWNEAIEIYRTSIEFADSDPDMVQHSGRMRISLGRLLMRQGYFDQAITVLEEAEKVLSGSHETVLGSVYANLGGSWLRKGEFHKAEVYLQQWLDVSERAGDKRALAMVMGTLGVLAEETGETERAKEFYLSQAELAEQTDQDFVASVSFHNLGNLALQSGDLDQAESFFEKDLAIARKLGYRSSESVAMGSLSRVYCYRGNYEKAIEFASFHLRVSQVLSNKFREIPALTDVFIAQLYSGAYLEAEETIELKKSIVETLEMKKGAVETYYLLGLLELFRERLVQAIHWMEFSIRYAEENQFKVDVLYYSLLGVLYMLTDNCADGEDCLGKAEELAALPSQQGGDVLEKLVLLASTHADPILAARVMVLVRRFHRG